MGKFLKTILLLPLFGGSYFLGYQIAKKKYEKLADEEVENVKKTLEEYYSGKDKKDKPEEKPTECEKKEEKKVVTQTSSIAENHKTEKDYINYAKQYISEDVERKIEAEKEALKEEINHNVPYVINSDEFERGYYIAKTLYYYGKEKILTDSDGRHLDHVEELIGPKAMELMGTIKSDIIYVRNERLEADFEIIVTSGSIYNVKSTDRVIPEEYEQ